MEFECGGHEAGMWKHRVRKRARKPVAFRQQFALAQTPFPLRIERNRLYVMQAK
jgi:hypothetical protein